MQTVRGLIDMQPWQAETILQGVRGVVDMQAWQAKVCLQGVRRLINLQSWKAKISMQGAQGGFCAAAAADSTSDPGCSAAFAATTVSAAAAAAAATAAAAAVSDSDSQLRRYMSSRHGRRDSKADSNTQRTKKRGKPSHKDRRNISGGVDRQQLRHVSVSIVGRVRGERSVRARAYGGLGSARRQKFRAIPAQRVGTLRQWHAGDCKERRHRLVDLQPW